MRRWRRWRWRWRWKRRIDEDKEEGRWMRSGEEDKGGDKEDRHQVMKTHTDIKIWEATMCGTEWVQGINQWQHI